MALPLILVNLVARARLRSLSHIPRDDPVTIAVLLSPVGVAYLRVHRGTWVETRDGVVVLGKACQTFRAGRRENMMSAL